MRLLNIFETKHTRERPNNRNFVQIKKPHLQALEALEDLEQLEWALHSNLDSNHFLSLASSLPTYNKTQDKKTIPSTHPQHYTINISSTLCPHSQSFSLFLHRERWFEMRFTFLGRVSLKTIVKYITFWVHMKTVNPDMEIETM